MGAPTHPSCSPVEHLHYPARSLRWPPRRTSRKIKSSGAWSLWHVLGRDVAVDAVVENYSTRRDCVLKLSLAVACLRGMSYNLSLIHISEPTRQAEISYAV